VVEAVIVKEILKAEASVILLRLDIRVTIVAKGK